MSEFPPYHEQLIARLQETAIGFNDFTVAEWKTFLRGEAVIVSLDREEVESTLMQPDLTTLELAGYLERD